MDIIKRVASCISRGTWISLRPAISELNSYKYKREYLPLGIYRGSRNYRGYLYSLRCPPTVVYTLF